MPLCLKDYFAHYYYYYYYLNYYISTEVITTMDFGELCLTSNYSS